MAAHDAEAFRFPDHHDPVPSLTDDVERLWSEGRHRSALEAILRFLRANGKSAQAYRWALPLLRTRKPDPSIAEPITDRQFRNPYFAPVATECARCTSFWYSSHVLLANAYGGIAVSNPIGQQCQACRYTLCRNCFTPRDARCPEPGCSGELGVPVLATGRPQGMPANPNTEKLEHVLILWHGSATDPEEIIELLDLACTWQDFGGITVSCYEVDRKDLDTDTGWFMLYRAESDGVISPGALDRTRRTRIDSPGLGQRVLLVTAAPATGPASQLSGPITYSTFRKRPAKRSWFNRKR